MPVTLQDVAQRAGVSMKTVSRVVNEEKNVAEETRQQVLQTIQELGYVPHVQASVWRPGKRARLCCIIPYQIPSFFPI
jgi:LacI family transcriptional regulator